MWCAVRIADDCWRQVWADTSVTIGMVRYGMARYGMAWYDMVWQGMVCVDTSVTIAKTMSVIVIEDRPVARTVVLIPKVLETPCVCRAHCRSCQCDKMVTFLEILKVLQLRSDPSIQHVFAQTFFHLSLATQFGRHSWQGVGKGLEHRH